MIVLITLLAFALICETAIAAALIWSILFPERRIWPPQKVTATSLVLTWGLTVVLIGAGLLLGLMDWNGIKWPDGLRWSVGLPLLLAGNAVVWSAVFHIGMAATSGAVDQLRTDGFYRWSRNPQYVADMCILIAWAILSASAWVIPVSLGGIALLALAPFAEEPWLRKNYGETYERYCKVVARYLGRKN